MRTKLQPGETVALTVKKHWIVLARPYLIFLGVAILFPFLSRQNLFGFEKLFKTFFVHSLIITATYLAYCIYDRTVDIWVVTNQRLIDEWGVITHRSKENPLAKINDIFVVQTILGRLFGYGDVSVQTAAALETCVSFVDDPHKLKETINMQKEGRVVEGNAVPPDMTASQFITCPQCGLQFIQNTGNQSKKEMQYPRSRSIKEKYEVAEASPGTVGADKELPVEKIPESSKSLDHLMNGRADPNAWKKQV